MRSLAPDVVLVFGTEILRDEVIASFRGNLINLHLGLSPYYRGSGTNFWPLVNREPEYVGATIHYLDAGIDSGPIIAHVRPEMRADDGPHDVGNRTIVAAAAVLARLAAAHTQEPLSASPQDGWTSLPPSSLHRGRRAAVLSQFQRRHDRGVPGASRGPRRRAGTGARMKVLFCLLHFGYERNFEPVIRELAARGHHVHIAAERSDRDPAKAVVEAIAREHPNVTVGTLPSREKDQYRDVVQRIRTGFDYLRYLEPTYGGMPGLRMRSEDRVPVGLLRLLDLPGMKTAPGRALVRLTLQQLERATPPSEAITEYLRTERPDALLITPLIGIVTSSQLDYVAAAKQLGIPTGFCVWSWDNLSSKALLRDLPDRIFVWNETQKHEAVELHRVPPQRVVVSGAQCFDRWFDRKPSRTREEFCRHVGLPVDRPYVMYVCSTMVWKSPPEAQFVVRWIRHLRASADPVLRDAAILVRPHPGRLQEWTDVDLSGFEHVALSGRIGAAGAGAAYPIDDDSRADYFDALYHSSAVVGINTSAFIEAGIIGRPVYAILADEFSGTQSGTIHFRYLTEVGGGVAEAGTRVRGARGATGRCVEGPVAPRGAAAPVPRVVRAAARPGSTGDAGLRRRGRRPGVRASVRRRRAHPPDSRARPSGHRRARRSTASFNSPRRTR